MHVKGFWSYSRADALHEGSRINVLRNEINAELGLLLGDEVGLFVDTNEIRIGDNWRIGLFEALQNAAFMMPILTPRYFKSKECRGELVYFINSCNRLNIQPMIFPIYLVNVWGFNQKSKDLLKRDLSAYQYLDFRKLRGSDSAVLQNTVQVFCLDVLDRLDATFDLQKFFENEGLDDTSDIYDDLSRASGA